MKILTFFLLTILTAQAERHPFINTDLKCLAKRKQSGGFATMYSELRYKSQKISEFNNSKTTYNCGLARRGSTKDKVCINKNYNDFRVYNLKTGQTSQKYSTLESCISSFNNLPGPRQTSEGMQFFSDAQLDYLRSRIPVVENKKINNALQNSRTVFYDDTNMVFGYQDSSGSPIGMRGNRVGYDTGINSNVPDIKKLTELFYEDKFLFPFATAGGTDTVENKYIVNFWLAPQDSSGNPIPVIYYKVKSHWSWIFPVGTIVGEVIFQQAEDDGEFYPFEVRTRERQIDGWEPEIFRPFATAESYALALKNTEFKSNSKNLEEVIQHLETSESLVYFKGPENHFTNKMGIFEGHLDKIPAIADTNLVKKFLLNRTYVSVKNKYWKSNGTVHTYAPSSSGGFNIVPKDYSMGITKVDRETCTKCHDQTSRSVGDFLFPAVAYGEVWGEDQVFTWHLFAVDQYYYFLGDDNRRVNPVMEKAGFVKPQKPLSSSALYQELRKPYSTKYWDGYN